MCWCWQLPLREADAANAVGLEVLRRTKGAGVLLEEALDAVDRVMNTAHDPEVVLCQLPHGSLVSSELQALASMLSSSHAATGASIVRTAFAGAVV